MAENETKQEAVTAQRIPGSSVELQRAKDGSYYWTIKVYFDAETNIVGAGENEDESEIVVLDEAAETLRIIGLIDARLRAAYLPKAVGFDGKEQAA